MVKRIANILGVFPFIGRSQSQKGTISTIDPVKKSASRFVQRRKQLGGPKSVMPVKKAMGGEASESIARSEILNEMRKRKRKKLIDRVDRIPQGAGKPKIVPKKKPKRDK